MQKTIVKPKPAFTTRLVKSEDLNHHGTLFAGRTAEWFVEAGFIAAALLVKPEGIVCAKIHGMHFTRPVLPGQILKFVSKVVYTGRSSLVSHIEVITYDSSTPFVKGFITFVYVDEDTKPLAHYIEMAPRSADDVALYNEARQLRK